MDLAPKAGQYFGAFFLRTAMIRNTVLSWVAMHAQGKELEAIRNGEVFHYAPRKFREQIVKSYGSSLSSKEQHCEVHLQAAKGYVVEFWKLIRDLTVADTDLSLTKSHGCYLYFFLGKPSARQLAQNVGGKADGDDADFYRIDGSKLCANPKALFYRPLDNVVVLRGDYDGPAIISPPQDSL